VLRNREALNPSERNGVVPADSTFLNGLHRIS
jgi:hypothetical protein